MIRRNLSPGFVLFLWCWCRRKVFSHTCALRLNVLEPHRSPRAAFSPRGIHLPRRDPRSSPALFLGALPSPAPRGSPTGLTHRLDFRPCVHTRLSPYADFPFCSTVHPPVHVPVPRRLNYPSFTVYDLLSRPSQGCRCDFYKGPTGDVMGQKVTTRPIHVKRSKRVVPRAPPEALLGSPRGPLLHPLPRGTLPGGGGLSPWVGVPPVRPPILQVKAQPPAGLGGVGVPVWPAVSGAAGRAPVRPAWP